MQKHRSMSVFLVFLQVSGTLFLSASSALAGKDVIPNDPLFLRQTYHQQIGTPQAWALTTGSVKSVVALLDSGVDTDHPDLQTNIWINPGEIPGDGIDNDKNGYIDDVNGWDFVDEIPDPNPKFNGTVTATGLHHGTLLAGVIAAEGNNALGITGISWRSKIMPLRVLDNKGEGDVLSVVKAIDYAIAKKVDVINLSFVGEGDSSFLRAAIKRAIDSGVVVVAAAGNDSINRHGIDLDVQKLYPICYEGVIGVASLDALGQKALFSHYGSCVDIATPGSDFYSTQFVNYERPGFDSFYGSGWSGTSLSTAVVSATVSLLKSIHTQLRGEEILSILQQSCDPVDDLNPEFRGRLGCGRLNVFKAVSATAELVQRQGGEIPSETPVRSMNLIAALAENGKQPLAVFDWQGSKKDTIQNFYPFAPFKPPYALSSSEREKFFAVGAGKGGGPHVRIFGHNKNLINQFFAYDPKFRGGVAVAVGDVDGDGFDDIVTAPGGGGGPHIKVFDQFGVLKNHFFAYHTSFRGGLSLALADMNNDGKKDIIVTPLKGVRQGDIRIFHGNGVLMTQFFAFKKTKINGVSLAVGDLNGDGSVEIVAAPLSGSGQVRVFSSLGRLKKVLSPYGKGHTGGYSLAVGDVNHDGKSEIVVSARRGRLPIQVLTEQGEKLSQFYPYTKSTAGGIIVSILQL